MCGTSLPRPLSGERELSRIDARIGVPSQISEPGIREADIPQNGGRLNGDASRDDVSARESRRPANFDLAEPPVSHSRAPISDDTERGQWFETRTSEPDHETNPWNLRTASSNTTPPPVSGPSFLGLADEPRQSVSYLLEDDESHGGRRLAVVVLLLLVIGGGSFLAWHWKRTGNLYLRPVNGQSAANGSSPNLSTSGSEVSPGAAQNERIAKMQQNQDKNALQSSSPQPVTAGDAKTPSGPPPVQNAQTVQNDESAALLDSAKQDSGKINQDSTKTPEATTAPAGSQPSVVNPSSKESKPASEEEATNAKKPASEDSPQKIAKASLRQPAPAAKDTQDTRQKDKQDPLFVQGQRYLYGTGVRQNCDLAQKSLMTAAENSNTQAQSTLATMYATGHCAPRSLPLAYRWFAKASHQEPNNPRIAQDLEILWKQMTPEEKQIAIKSR